MAAWEVQAFAVVVVAALPLLAGASVVCAPGYTCWTAPDSITWVMKEDGNVNGPSCKGTCEAALGQSTVFHSCDPRQPVLNEETFGPVAAGLNVTCRHSGRCWSGRSGSGQLWVGRDLFGDERKCYYPDPMQAGGVFNCDAHPGNANCYGKRYRLVCPCKPVQLEEACEWPAPNEPSVAHFQYPVSEGDTTSDTSCLGRINYWRQRACAEGWVECPPSGLPPMVECVGCHACANSQAEYDSQHGAHKSFKRCGERVQGVGGGPHCARVIDAFVSERKPDAEGVWRCQGHCGPILKAGCQTFHWGKAATAGTHVLNWRSCKPDTCDAYCANPTANECFGGEEEPSAISAGDSVILKSGGGKALVAKDGAIVESSGGAEETHFVIERKTAADESEIESGEVVFLTNPATGNRVTVQGSHSTVPAADPGSVHVFWDHMGSWQNLVVSKVEGDGVIRSGDTVFLTGHRGDRLAIGADGVVNAFGGDSDEAATFTLERIEAAVAAAAEALLFP